MAREAETLTPEGPLGSRVGAYPGRTEVSTDRTHEQDYAVVLSSELGQ